MEGEYREGAMTKQKAIVVDLDGTCALIHQRKNGPYDASRCDEEDLPNIPVIETVKALTFAGYYVVFCSGREDKHREPTMRFLHNHFPEMNGDYVLFMRQTKDQRKDAIVKREIYEEQIAHRFDVLLVLDDRASVTKMWREELGLTVLQCADGDF